MSLTLAMRNALSGLSLNQYSLAVTSNNISNANTAGYSRKLVQQISRSANGVGSGVDIAAVTRNVDNSLLSELRSQMAKRGFYSNQESYLNRVTDTFGVPGSANAINANIGRLASSFEAMGSRPQNAQSQLDTITDAMNMARQINDMANSTQNLRGQADSDIAASVNKINELATRINDLNNEIVRNSGASGQQSNTDAMDQRDQAVRELSGLIDVSTYTRADGRMVVVVAGGYNLVADSASTLAYNAATAVSPATTFNAITVNGSGNITSAIRNGKMKSLIDLRDTTLQNYMAQLDTMALALRDRVNAVHNDGTCFPAQRTLTGTQTTAAGTAFPASTGSVRIAVTDATGAIVRVIDYDLSTAPATVGGVVTAINTLLGVDGTCTLNANGQMVIQAANAANGIAINENNGNVGATGTGFSQYFGLNDFFVGADNSALKGDLALALAVNPTLVSNPSFVSRADLSLSATAGQIGITPGDGSVAQRLAGVFTTNYSFSAVGGMPAMTSTIADFSASIISYNANLTSRARSDSDISTTTLDNLDKRISSTSGVSVDEEMSNMVQLQNAYNASAQVIKTVNSMFEQLERIMG